MDNLPFVWRKLSSDGDCQIRTMKARKNHERIGGIQFTLTFHFFIPVLMAFLVACGTEYESKLSEFKIDKRVSIGFNLDSLSSNYWPVGQHWVSKENIQYLIHQNPFPTDPNRLFFSNLNKIDQGFSIEFEVEGPNGVGAITDFYFHNFDSIFLIDRYSYQMSLVDSFGNLKKVFRLKETDGNKPDNSSVLPYTISGRAIMKIGQYLLIPTVPDADPIESDYSLKNLLLVVNLESGQVKKMLGFPKSYKGAFRGGADHFLPSLSQFQGNTILVSYPIVDSIFVFDLETENLVLRFYSSSTLVKNIEAASPSKWGNEDKVRYRLGVPRHYSIIFDHFRKQFLRVSFEAFDQESISEILNRRPAITSRKSSLIVHNETGQIIGSFIIGLNYNPMDILILESGVFIALNSKNEDKKEYHKILID